MAHRYRKGQFWRPPTAAESAAHADAAEAHRRAPAKAQDRAPIGQTMVVKTPTDGIDARDGDAISWAWCDRCVETNTASGKQIVPTDERIQVYNLQESAIAGNAYVQAAMMDCGFRYVVGMTTFRWGKLDADLTSGSSATVSLWGTNGESWGSDTGDNVTAYAPPFQTSTIASGTWVRVYKMPGGSMWIVDLAGCPS